MCVFGISQAKAATMREKEIKFTFVYSTRVFRTLKTWLCLALCQILDRERKRESAH